MAQDQAGNTTQLQRQIRLNIPSPESELTRVARNLPDLSTYFVPVLISLPLLLILAYLLTRPVALAVSAESNNFQPGLPEESRFLRLVIDLSKAARTTVEIKGRQDNTVATLLHRRHRGSGQHTLHWDGYDDFGRVGIPAIQGHPQSLIPPRAFPAPSLSWPNLGDSLNRLIRILCLAPVVPPANQPVSAGNPGCPPPASGAH